jgi:hypothetical protein
MNRIFLSIVAVLAVFSLSLTTSAQASSGHAVSLDANQVIQAESHLVSNVPGTFSNGTDVSGIIGADRFYNSTIGGGITGQNTVSLSIEAGHIWNGHESLGHAANTNSGGGAAEDVDRHATWVGMVMGGRGANKWETGISPNTDLRSRAIATSWNGSPYALGFNIGASSFNNAYAAGFAEADVINSSWGSTDPEGDGFIAIAIDGLAASNPQTTFVASAGNSGSGANTVGSPASGYNGISVGALGSPNNYDTIASFSSRGPQNYGDPVNGISVGVRAPVDIAAPGTNLMAAFYGGTTGGNTGGTNNPGSNLYSFSIGGTSFSAPIVAAGVSLMKSASITDGMATESRDTRVIKAAMLNAASKVPAWDNGQADVSGVSTTTQALDWTYGAGALDLDQTYDQYLMGVTDVAGLTGGTVDPLGWDYGEVSVGGSNDYVINSPLVGGTYLTTTLTWFRDRDYDSVNILAFDERQADLDLQIWDATFTTLLASSETQENTTEHLHFMLPSTGSYGIRVLGIGENFDLVNGNSDIYGLAWSATAVPEPATGMLVLIGLSLAVAPRRKVA